MPKSVSASPWISGRFLVATPAMPDPRFAQSVIFMCEHGPDGALGLIVNKSIDDLPLSQVLEQLEIPVSPAMSGRPVLFGGPVEMQLGLVLHSIDYRRQESLVIDNRCALTSSLEILKDIAEGGGPAQSVVALGHSGWGPGQLDRELQDNTWLVIEDDVDLIFGENFAGKWSRAMGKLGSARGLDAAAFSHSGGRA